MVDANGGIRGGSAIFHIDSPFRFTKPNPILFAHTVSGLNLRSPKSVMPIRNRIPQQCNLEPHVQ
jgi:hypothetical protein